ncbi:hypothetical protein C0J52_18119 [Blattella germanica]|nr:hypothetical protein C0J52_18119 [Blattella germanica]
MGCIESHPGPNTMEENFKSISEILADLKKRSRQNEWRNDKNSNCVGAKNILEQETPKQHSKNALAGESLDLTVSEIIQILEDPIDENIKICDSGSELEGDDEVSDDFQSDNRLISWKKLHHKTKMKAPTALCAKKSFVEAAEGTSRRLAAILKPGLKVKEILDIPQDEERNIPEADFSELNLLSFLWEGAGFKTTQLDFRREIVQDYLKRYMNSVKGPVRPTTSPLYSHKSRIPNDVRYGGFKHYIKKINKKR